MTTAVAGSSYGWAGTRWTSRVLDVLRRRPELVTAAVCAVIVAVGQRGPDLPAQAYRVSLIRHHGLVIFDSHWYGGAPLPRPPLSFSRSPALSRPRRPGAPWWSPATAPVPRGLRGGRGP